MSTGNWHKSEEEYIQEIATLKDIIESIHNK
jgi:hypothetical protein